MNPKEWHELVDDYLATGKMTGDPGLLDTLDPYQRFWVNETKKSIKRTNK